MKILLLGADGQVGWELRRALLPLGHVIACGRAQADLAHVDAARAAVREHAPDVIVNAAAYTAVDRAEEESDLARRVNSDAVAMLAEEAQRSDAWMVHYSTDYVYDGTKSSPYVETDATNPVNAYGASKLQGDAAIGAAGCRHIIFRTCWVYAVRGHNFPKTMLRLAQTRDDLRVVSDQASAPTSAELIADVTAHALAQALKAPAGAPAGEGGIYHLAAAGETSWYGFACRVLELAAMRGFDLKVRGAQVAPVASADYPSAAKRIANSRLATDKLRSTFGLSLPTWEVLIERFMAELPREGL